MAIITKKRSKKAGLPPGSLVHIGEKKVENVRISVINYDESNFEEKEIKNVEECIDFKDTPATAWISISGIHRPEILAKIGEGFGLHPLVVEDILNTDQRPKMEDFGNYLYAILKIINYDEKTNEIIIDQISLILGKNFVISFQEKDEEILNAIKERINASKNIRKMGADYLAYLMIDTIVDNYFSVLEKIGEKIELLEENVLANPKQEISKNIQNLKRDMIFLRKSIWPLRDVIVGLERGESALIKKTTKFYLRDVYDHTVQVIESIETFRDMVSGILDIYLSSISNKMNEVMKVLTIIATIFIPLTFITGLYGMNFKNMPELEWEIGYFLALIIMAAVAGFMIFYFRKKKWL